MNNLKSAYNRCLKIFFGYSHHFSLTQLLLELGLPRWNTLIINSQVVAELLQQKYLSYYITLHYIRVI